MGTTPKRVRQTLRLLARKFYGHTSHQGVRQRNATTSRIRKDCKTKQRRKHRACQSVGYFRRNHRDHHCGDYGFDFGAWRILRLQIRHRHSRFCFRTRGGYDGRRTYHVRGVFRHSRMADDCSRTSRDDALALESVAKTYHQLPRPRGRNPQRRKCVRA